MADFAMKSLRRGALIGVALAALAGGAAQAQDADHQRGRRGWSQAAQESGQARPAPQPRAERQARPAQVAQDSGGRQRAPEAQRSERRSEGGTYGRQWNGGGSVRRPAQATDAGQPAIPQRAAGSAGWRDGGRYEARTQDRDRSDSRRQTREAQTTQQSGTWGARNSTYRDPRRDTQASSTWRNTNDWRRGDAGRQWSRDWRQDRRYDWNSYRSSNRELYRMAPYYAPYRDYSYRRLSIGFVLQNLFFGQRYWINDPWQYRLPAVYGPYRWVRYYDDAVLVDIYTGRVVDVINRFFW